MKIIIALVAVLALTGCSKPAETSTAVGRDFVVEKLFTHDNCTVYRFYDSGNKYFTNCQGSTTWSESCGKNCTRQQGVN